MPTEMIAVAVGQDGEIGLIIIIFVMFLFSVEMMYWAEVRQHHHAQGVVNVT